MLSLICFQMSSFDVVTAMNTSPTISKNNLSKLEDLCRMCASPCINSTQIYGSEGVANDLAVKFNHYLPVKVNIPLTSMVFISCIFLLLKSFILRFQNLILFPGIFAMNVRVC